MKRLLKASKSENRQQPLNQVEENAIELSIYETFLDSGLIKRIQTCWGFISGVFPDLTVKIVSQLNSNTFRLNSSYKLFFSQNEEQQSSQLDLEGFESFLPDEVDSNDKVEASADGKLKAVTFAFDSALQHYNHESGGKRMFSKTAPMILESDRLLKSSDGFSDFESTSNFHNSLQATATAGTSATEDPIFSRQLNNKAMRLTSLSSSRSATAGKLYSIKS
jgi:hypothetical protein